MIGELVEEKLHISIGLKMLMSVVDGSTESAERCVRLQLVFLAWTLVCQVVCRLVVKLAKLLKRREAPSRVLSNPLLTRPGFFPPKTVSVVYKGPLVCGAPLG